MSYSNFEHSETFTQTFPITEKNALLNLETANLEFLGKTYLVFHTNNIGDITNYFDFLTITYNGTTSTISSEFLKIILYLHSTISLRKTIDKMLQNNPIYFPIQTFSHNNQIYAKNQEISFNLSNVKNCDKIELMYDNLILKDGLTYENIYQNNKIPIEICSIITLNNMHNQINIPNKGLQEILWNYKNKQSIVTHPVEYIGLNGVKNNDDIMTIVEPSSIDYFMWIQSYSYHTNTQIDLYSYSFVPNPENYTPDCFLSNEIIYVKLEQFVKDNDCSQIILTKSIRLINLKI